VIVLQVGEVRGTGEQLVTTNARGSSIYTDERTEIPDACVDVVLLVQAFQWFDATAASS
jgi:hypothetical protein